jgi:hypothetical protein
MGFERRFGAQQVDGQALEKPIDTVFGEFRSSKSLNHDH